MKRKGVYATTVMRSLNVPLNIVLMRSDNVIERTAARSLRVFKKEFKAFDCYALDSTVTLPNEQPQKVCSNRIGDKIEE